MNDQFETPSHGYSLSIDQGVAGRGPEVKCAARSTGASLAMYRDVVDGDGPPPHVHTHEDETIYILDGTLRVECGPDRWLGGPDTTFFLPRGLTHTFRSVDGPATILFIATPGRLDDEFFRRREEATSRSEIAELARKFF